MKPAFASKKMTQHRAAVFISALAAANPDAQSELIYKDAFTLLVAVVLSAQATDLSVNKVTKALFVAAPDPFLMHALGEEGIATHIRSIGLWRNKARHVHRLSEQLITRHQGHVPAEREALEALAGVGRKTASVVLNVIFGQSAMAVDTHIFRLGNRTGLAPGKTVLAVEKTLIEQIPPAMLRPAHHWLILHGRYVCKARTPLCARCAAFGPCLFAEKERIRAAKPRP